MSSGGARRGLATAGIAMSGAVLGITSTGINFLILIYYDQVLHLRPLLAGLALAIALGVDGVADPVTGWLSDHVRSRLGRRHPFLLAGILPIAAFYVAIWFPWADASHQWLLFAHLLATSVGLRLSITLVDVPANALIAELSDDYDQRTAFAAAKTGMNWCMANLCGIALYAVWLADLPGAAAGSGTLNGPGYRQAALWFGGLLLVVAASVPLLLWGEIPRLRGQAPGRPARLATLPRDLLAAYRNPSVLALLASAVLFAAGVGMTQTLWQYFLSFFWRLGSAGVNRIQATYLVAAVIAWVVLPRLSRGREKRSMALWLSGLFWINDVAPIALRLAGMMPQNGSPALLPVLMAFSVVDGILFNMVLAIVLSMLTDAVEDNMLRTGLRQEAVVLAGQTLVTKASTALGTVLGAGLLAITRFPQAGGDAAMPASVLRDLGMAFTGTMWGLGLLSTLCLAGYRLSRAGHARALAALRPGQ